MSDYCEAILAEARKWIGRETPVRWGRYPVEYEPIRRWCHMANCNNPLYLDEDYARATKWGGVICPPLMIPIFATQGLTMPVGASGPEIDWPPPKPGEEPEQEILLQVPSAGNRAINLGGETEFFKVVLIGDRVGFKRRLVDVYTKSIRLDPEAFWIATDTIYLNQRNDIVAINHNLLIRHRDREQIAATTPEQLELIRA